MKRITKGVARAMHAVTASHRDHVVRSCWLLSALTLMSVASGCHDQPPQPSPQQEPVRPSVLTLSPAGLRDHFLVAEDESYRWRFTDDRFVLESFGQPLSEQLQGRMLRQAHPVYRIAGRWQLLDEGRRIRFDNLQADNATPQDDVEMSISDVVTDGLVMDGTGYRWLDYPPHQEMRPKRIYRGSLEQILQPDRLLIREGDVNHEVRLMGIVCPHASQPFADEARAASQRLAMAAPLAVKVFDLDADGCEVAQIWNSRYRCLNVELVAAGLAWHDKRANKEWVLTAAEDQARDDQTGIWSQPEAIPPWEF